MSKMRTFRSNTGNFKLPLFFPDATRAFIRTLDASDIERTKTKGILVNTYHLYKDLGTNVINEFDGVRKFMGWKNAVISDSGGFQVMSLVKKDGCEGSVSDKGVTFKLVGERKMQLTPEDSMRFQMELKTDLLVVLDDFTPPDATYKEAKESVKRTISWAKRSKDEFERICKKKKLSKEKRPYLIAVAQGGEYLDLREECTKELVKIGFDGMGFGGWPVKNDGSFNYDAAKIIADNTPANYLLYGLGIGKPDEVLGCYRLGFDIFDCVLPTRDARHKRLYVYNADSIDKIDLRKKNFYSYYIPDKQKHLSDTSVVSKACDCLLCTKYSRAYLAHLFRSKETLALRLSTIHNLRFYSLLMEKIREAGRNI